LTDLSKNNNLSSHPMPEEHNMLIPFTINGILIRFQPQMERWADSPVTKKEHQEIKKRIDRDLRSSYFDREAYHVVTVTRGLAEMPTVWVEVDSSSYPDYLPSHGGRVGVHLDSHNRVIGKVILKMNNDEPEQLVFHENFGVAVNLPADMRTFAELEDFLTRSTVHHRIVHFILRGLELTSGPLNRFIDT